MERKKLEFITVHGYKTVALGAENSKLYIELFAVDVRSRLGFVQGIAVLRYSRQGKWFVIQTFSLSV